MAKRSLGEVGGVVSEFSPHHKHARIDALAEFIKTRFRLRSNAFTSKARVVSVVIAEYDQSATAALTGRAVSKAFGCKVHFKGRAEKAVYSGIEEFHKVSRIPRLIHRTDRSTQTPENTVPLPSPIKRPPGSRLPVKSNAGGDKQHTNSVRLSDDEVELIGKLRSNDGKLFEYMHSTYPNLRAKVVDYTQNLICQEIHHYASLTESKLRSSSGMDMQSFSLEQCWKEYKSELPIFTHLLFKACTRKDQHKRTQKSIESVTPAITTVVGKCLGIYSKRLSAQRTFYSLVLSDGGLTDVAMNRLAKLYDCVTHQALLPKVDSIASGFDRDINTWKQDGKQFSIVFDNIDIYIRRRKESSTSTNLMQNMVQAIAVLDRIISDSSRDHLKIDEVQPGHILPSEDDSQTLKKLMADEVLRIWSDIPVIKQLKLTSLTDQHDYSDMMRKKSEMVNLGVMMKNENKRDELLVCLQQYNSLVGESNGVPDHKICVGDYLSFERGQQVISSQSDRKTATDRLEGLVMAMADFHVQINFLKMTYKILFSSDSQPSPGTLSHAKDFLNARNVVADAGKRYYDCGALFDKVFRAHLLTDALDELKLPVSELSQTSDVITQSPQLTEDSLREAAERTVSKFVDLTVPKLTDVTDIRCNHCNKKYSSDKNLYKHHILTHPDKPFEMKEADSVFNYSSSLITLGLFRMLHNRAIQYGNGPVIMLLYKFMLLMFKANGSFKYGCGLLETIIQTKILPANLSDRLVWNRFYNSSSKPNSNIPLDLKMEHENRFMKERLKTFRGQFTQAHIDRISRGRHCVTKMIRKLDNEIDYHKTKGKNPTGANMVDIKMLVELYVTCNLHKETGYRAHSSSLTTIMRNPLAGMNGKILKEWLEERIELCKIRNYYQQFNKN